MYVEERGASHQQRSNASRVAFADSEVQRRVTVVEEVQGHALSNLLPHDLEVTAVARTCEGPVIWEVASVAVAIVKARPASPRCCAPLALLANSSEKGVV
eukprot:scaffold80203_cov73-Phaeocystis_antarctica.AAC.4